MCQRIRPRINAQGKATIQSELRWSATKWHGSATCKLVPGMPVDAFVQTGERTVISYLMKPLSDQIVKAFREK